MIAQLLYLTLPRRPTLLSIICTTRTIGVSLVDPLHTLRLCKIEVCVHQLHIPSLTSDTRLRSVSSCRVSLYRRSFGTYCCHLSADTVSICSAIVLHVLSLDFSIICRPNDVTDAEMARHGNAPTVNLFIKRKRVLRPHQSQLPVCFRNTRTSQPGELPPHYQL